MHPDYCRACDGYSAHVGKMDDDGICAACWALGALKRAHLLLDTEHAHSPRTWDDRKRVQQSEL